MPLSSHHSAHLPTMQGVARRMRSVGTGDIGISSPCAGTQTKGQTRTHVSHGLPCTHVDAHSMRLLKASARHRSMTARYSTLTFGLCDGPEIAGNRLVQTNSTWVDCRAYCKLLHVPVKTHVHGLTMVCAIAANLCPARLPTTLLAQY